MLQLFTWWFKLKGWETAGNLPTELKKFVIIAAPHTSNWDFVYSLAALRLMGIDAKYLVKKELFWWPLKLFLNNTGGIPVERKRKSKNNLIENIINLFASKDQLCLMLSPEGTRKRVNRWKSGFYHIAMEANVPICLAYLDYKNKVGGAGHVIYLTGDKEKDMQEIKNFYTGITAKYPELFDLEAIVL